MLSLILAAAFVLAACAPAATAVPPTAVPTTAPPKQVTVEWWHITIMDPGKTLWQDMANEYMAAHPKMNFFPRSGSNG